MLDWFHFDKEKLPTIMRSIGGVIIMPDVTATTPETKRPPPSYLNKTIDENQLF
jgi:hypothetical protein